MYFIGIYGINEALSEVNVMGIYFNPGNSGFSEIIRSKYMDK